MGTWAAGPFESDEALDFVGEIAGHLVEAVESFVRAPRIDEGFETAFAAIGLMNLIVAGADMLIPAASPLSLPEPADARRWRGNAQVL